MTTHRTLKNLNINESELQIPLAITDKRHSTNVESILLTGINSDEKNQAKSTKNSKPKAINYDPKRNAFSNQQF